MHRSHSPKHASRVIGDIHGNRPGPTIVAFGGLHGNEPGGVIAIRRVVERLSFGKDRLCGRFIGLLGNEGALSKGLRFLDRDLNRCWDDTFITGLQKQDPSLDSPEDMEQREILALLESLHDSATQPIVFLDLHSTSGRGAPFCAMADTLRNRTIAFALGIPVILGLEEALETAMLGWLSDLGHVGVVVEGGQHDDPTTPDFLEAAIWLSLVAAGALREGDVRDFTAHQERMKTAATGLPEVVEILYRYTIAVEDHFRMRPGYENFQSVTKGEPLADDVRGEVPCPIDGCILMPLYQPQGEDGFFLAREVNRRWLDLSTSLRERRADRMLALLPGVSWHPDDKDRLIVDQSVARFQTLNIFHLFGYRKRHDEGGHLVFSRRRPDHHPLSPAGSANPLLVKG